MCTSISDLKKLYVYAYAYVDVYAGVDADVAVDVDVDVDVSVCMCICICQCSFNVYLYAYMYSFTLPRPWLVSPHSPPSCCSGAVEAYEVWWFVSGQSHRIKNHARKGPGKLESVFVWAVIGVHVGLLWPCSFCLSVDVAIASFAGAFCLKLYGQQVFYYAIHSCPADGFPFQYVGGGGGARAGESTRSRASLRGPSYAQNCQQLLGLGPST